MKFWAIFLAALPLFGADPSRFPAVCRYDTGAFKGSAFCQIQDLPERAYWNRWKITLDKSLPILSLPRSASWIKAASGEKVMKIDVLVWGTLTVLPLEREVRDAFSKPSFEIRPQNLTVTVYDKTTEILFEEGFEDSDGYATPSEFWLGRLKDALIRIGGVKVQKGR